MENQFTSVVEINLNVQRVMEETRHLYLVSLNAMFLAKRSGAGAEAFQRVTGELRVFSDRMQRQMDDLGEWITDLVRRVSELRRHERCWTLMSRAQALARQAGYEGDMGRGHLRRNVLLTAIQAGRIRFGRSVAQAMRLCVAGENLAVLAKMEAAAASHESTARLMRVADELAAVVGRIRELLEGAMHHVNLIEELAA